VHRLWQPDEGDLLVFLPGAPEIRKTRSILEGNPPAGDVEILPLYGALPVSEQDRVLALGRKRRVVLSTNIAETSLTVPGVTAVIDTGLAKQPRHDTGTGLDRLELIRISLHSAEQRAGRAGRTAPGRALRLWTEHEHAGLIENTLPEIRRVDLAPHLLNVLAFQPGDPAGFPFFDPPEATALGAALRLLEAIGAVDRQFTLTERGCKLARLPVHPRLGNMLLAAREKRVARGGAELVALLEEGRRLSRGSGPAECAESDLLLLLERPGGEPAGSRSISRARDQLLRILGVTGRDHGSERDLLAVTLAGFADRLCRRRSPGSREAVMVGGRGVRLAEESCVREAEWFVAVEADAGKRGERSVSLVRKASAVTLEMIEDQFPEQLCTEQGAVFDEKKRAVTGVRRNWYSDLLLSERIGAPVDPRTVAVVLAEAAAAHFDEVFVPDERATRFRARVVFAARSMPEEGWPDLRDEGIREWLPDLCTGKSRFVQLQKVDWTREFKRRLGHRLQAVLTAEVPERFEVPSGKRIRIDYEAAGQPGGKPVLAVRIQQAFGLKSTPRVARGRVPVLVHLLAPNGRPAQVTTDLANFWKNTYPQVRKELRARYPRHAWPEVPG
jgi:ATP-dependent helicase HrpB